jgi:dihydrodipicolinate synthase/N-acetylneuraminate lyase
MNATLLDPEKARLLAAGTVIPAHPLALTVDGKFDERRQRALTRYYMDAGAGGVAVAVHTTQFAIHQPKIGLLRPVLELAAEAIVEERLARPFLRIAGVCGPVSSSIAEAMLAADLGYDAVLLCPVGVEGLGERDLLIRAGEVGKILPIIGFQAQTAIGGRSLSVDFWRALAELPCVAAVKIAPFNRYSTLDVVRGISESGRGEEIALYTGNDDSILTDLLMEVNVRVKRRTVHRHIVGGLLGQWAIWTCTAVGLLEHAHRAIVGDDVLLRELVQKAADLTDANGAVFDARHGFRGCIPGIHEVLRRQGLLESVRCLDSKETLGPGQIEEIERVCRSYPWLLDDEFIENNRDRWLL